MINILLKLKPVVLCLAIPLLQQGKLSERHRGIVPLHTTRSQVETLLGPSRTLDNPSTYYFQDETINIFYSTFRCGDSQNLDKWNVLPNTVISVMVIPKNKFPLAELPFDLSKFRKERGSFDALDESRLISGEEGITLAFSSTYNMIHWYAYGPKASDRHLRCSDFSEDEERRKRDCYPSLLRVECTADEIAIGKPVRCTAYTDAPNPKFEWKASSGSSQSARNGPAIVVTLTDARKSNIEVTAKIVAPNVCVDNATWRLDVGKKRN